MIFTSILKINLAKLRSGNTSKTAETHPSSNADSRQFIDPVNVPSGIETKQINWLGFMEGEGRGSNDLTQWVLWKSKTYF
jgi:hypothetical protein